ncbi:MAG: DUF6444 domain-containing protein [Actinobacteria bacterium]|nr:DUF6444 domain-containing protein [Actinomycetota bacterium]MCL5446965.1 DUF6444 domain-containing protein [Actinomycetota bacterium]
MLRADNAALCQEVERLSRRIVELEKKSGRNSQNSSMAPSSDTGGESCKARDPFRKARRAMGRKPGRQDVVGTKVSTSFSKLPIRIVEERLAVQVDKRDIMLYGPAALARHRLAIKVRK